MKMANFHEKVSHDAHLFAPNWLTDEQDHFLWKVESHSKWRFFMKKWVMMLTSLLQIGSLMSRTTFCEKLKVDENGDFSWKSESWCSPLCSKLAHWWAGPLFVKSWKLMKMAIFHEKVSHGAHLFAQNWLTDEQDHFLWKVESHSKWRFFMKKWVMMLTSLLQILSTFQKKWSCSSVSQFGAKRWASWLTFSWKIAILSDFQLFTKSGPAHQWANLEQRGEHHDSLFHEKSPFWVTFNFSQKVVLLISEPIWSKEVSIMNHFSWKITIFINFQLFTKSGPAHQWANLEQRGEHHDSLFHEKSPFWVTFNFSQKVVLLISEPIWRKEVSIMTHFFMKNRHFEWLLTFHKKWSCSSVSQFGAKRWASWLTFSWKIAILSDFQLFTKSGPAHQWANLEQRGEHHDSLFHEKSPFWVTFNFSQKVVLLISEPIWSKEVSIMTHFFMKNRHFHQLSTFHKKWSCSSVSQFGAKRWASWLTFSWKIAILSDFQLFTKSGPAHQWANLEQRGEHHDSLFHEKSPFWVTFNFSQKVVLLISEPIWSKEVSIMTHFFMKNRHFHQLSTFHKKWSCSSVSQFGAKRWASWLTFSWKIAILSDFQLFTKSGPAHQWANLEQRGEHHDSLFHEKSPFWVTFNFSQKVVLLISEPIWSKEVSIMTHFFMKNRHFEWLSTFHKKWSCSSVSQFGAKRWASWLTFSWKFAIFINFQLLTKSGHAH